MYLNQSHNRFDFHSPSSDEDIKKNYPWKNLSVWMTHDFRTLTHWFGAQFYQFYYTGFGVIVFVPFSCYFWFTQTQCLNLKQDPLLWKKLIIILFYFYVLFSDFFFNNAKLLLKILNVCVFPLSSSLTNLYFPTTTTSDIFYYFIYYSTNFPTVCQSLLGGTSQIRSWTSLSSTSGSQRDALW